MGKTLEQITFETAATGVLYDFKRGQLNLNEALTELTKLKQETEEK